MNHGNPYGYEAGFTIENHRDELIERMGKAIKRVNELEAEIESLKVQSSATSVWPSMDNPITKPADTSKHPWSK